MVNDEFCHLGIDGEGLNNSYITFRDPEEGETISNPNMDPNLYPFPYDDPSSSTLRISSGNHEVVLIGCIYTEQTNMTIPEKARGKYFWKLRNSWGEECGDQGNFYIERDLNDEKNNIWENSYHSKYSLLRLYSSVNYLTLNIK